MNSIKLENIHKKFGKKQVLSNISLEISEGCICGLLGPSGCGKTTLVKIMAGILKQDAGSVFILGQKMPDFKLMQQTGYMAQIAALYPTLSAYENLKFFGSLYHLSKEDLKKRIFEVAELVGLSDDLKKKVSIYSGGMKQRLSLAIALLSNPKVLLLDEPTVGIDPILRQSIWNELYQLSSAGVTKLITTHVMDEVAKCQQLAMMRDGVIIASGTPIELQTIAKTDNIEDAFIYFGQTSHVKDGLGRTGVIHED